MNPLRPRAGFHCAIALSAAACAAALPAIAAAQVAPLPVATLGGTRLDIVATGEVARAPDIATISAGVVTQAATASAALAENATRMTATIAALRRAGVADRDIQSNAINLSPQYRYGENVPPVLTGYQASNQVSIRFRDIKRAGAILDALVQAGANQINGPAFSLDKPAAALDEARTAAVAAARTRADLYARAAGLTVRRIVAIAEDGEQSAQPRPMMMAMARMEKDSTPVQAGEQTLAITLRVTFELQ
ncbi:SIMPL domain-containing protein [Sphingomonas montana]|uniref:SIMPL domain-containing protein n=1 Tax=Sphingomonas montana TaxID=1843236 RepID=UPI00096E5716|nr:SIMPL domain-containing protein [Sphingomonas montana]